MSNTKTIERPKTNDGYEDADVPTYVEKSDQAFAELARENGGDSSGANLPRPGERITHEQAANKAYEDLAGYDAGTHKSVGHTVVSSETISNVGGSTVSIDAETAGKLEGQADALPDPTVPYPDGNAEIEPVDVVAHANGSADLLGPSVRH